MSAKLDHSTFKLWKESIDPENLPNFQSFIQFLNARRQLLENTLPIEAGQQLNKPILKFNNKSEKPKLRNSAGSTAFKSYHSTTNNYSCPCCKASHPIYMCDKFRDLSVSERGQFILKHKCCTNCLRPDHFSPNCKVKQSCKICSRRHHTLLHINNGLKQSSASSSNYCSFKLQSANNVILSTAVVFVIDRAGNRQLARILLDAGSQINFCTESFAKKLQLNLTKSNICLLYTSRCV